MAQTMTKARKTHKAELLAEVDQQVKGLDLINPGITKRKNPSDSI